jgi:hypothetical protein
MNDCWTLFYVQTGFDDTITWQSSYEVGEIAVGQSSIFGWLRLGWIGEICIKLLSLGGKYLRSGQNAAGHPLVAGFS